jgi:hypothetical protein
MTASDLSGGAAAFKNCFNYRVSGKYLMGFKECYRKKRYLGKFLYFFNSYFQLLQIIFINRVVYCLKMENLQSLLLKISFLERKKCFFVVADKIFNQRNSIFSLIHEISIFIRNKCLQYAESFYVRFHETTYCMQRLIFAGLFCLSCLFFTCIGVPDFSLTPVITYNKIIISKNVLESDNTTNRVDSVRIFINFEDGDGDLGIADNERSVPPFTGDRLNNYYITAFRKNKEVVTKFNDYHGIFGLLNEEEDLNRERPIRGSIERFITFQRSAVDIFPNDTMFFDIYILDRSGNQSNTITTETVILKN